MRTGLLLINLGTPDEPSAGAVRRYLREFLGDPRVLDIGPITATQEKHKTIPLSPIVGIASLAGGIALLVVGSKTRV